MPDSYCFITPTYAGDIDRFAVLRESIMTFAADVHHVAIIQTEHFDHFESRFAHQPNLELLTTSRVLPPHMELQRGGSRLSRKLIGLRRAFKQDYRRIDGWRAQQLTKIYSLAQSEHEVGIFLDSDIFLSRHVKEADFFSQGKPKIFRAKCHNLESAALWLSAADIHGIDPLSTNETHNFVFAPAVFRRSTAELLINEMISRHGQRWELPFCSEKKPSEYNLLGITAMRSNEIKKYHIEQLETPEDLHYAVTADDMSPPEASRAVRESGKSFFLIQSNTKISPDYMSAIFSDLKSSSN